MSAITTRDLVEIDEPRLLRRLDDLAQRGALPSGGIYRPLYSPSWVSAMDLATTWMKEAALLVRRDAVGNVWGRIEGSRGAASSRPVPTSTRSVGVARSMRRWASSRGSKR